MPQIDIQRTMLLGLSCFLATAMTIPALAKEDASPTPQWLWSSKSAKPNEDAQFQKSFTVKGEVESASLSIACDNWCRMRIGSTWLGQHYSWSQPLRQDVTKAIKPGKNTLVIHARNESGAAGILAQLTLRYEDGTRQDIVSDGTWQARGEGTKGWQPATVLAELGAEPWGDLPFGDELPESGSTPVEDITLLPDFAIDLIYSVPKGLQGSWVSLTTDNKGRLIASDQYGGLYRITPGPVGEEEKTKIEALSVDIGQAQGLLYAYDSLYVMVSGRQAAKGSGLYRLRDTNGDDTYDSRELLMKLGGPQGEHGPHAIRKGPAGRIWVIAGNHTDIPEFEKDSPFKNYAEDLFLPRNPDGNGHATGRMAPGGWIASLKPDGSDCTLHCAGFRNPYDMAFNKHGELFAYDADMEWDTGVPWYRPTRVNHCVSAAEFGWRYGTGKWPEYYVDSVGSVVDIGLGSPTGIEFGYGAKFPVKYQHALFINDWTYGKIYAVHMEPKGATYTATFETFVTGRPLPVTDIVINPLDGYMYITIGGRRMQSGLYRIRYTGEESTAPVPLPVNKEAAAARGLRKRLEVFHRKHDPRSVDFAWPKLGSPDRSIRYAARVAIENQPLEWWKAKALAETRIPALIQAMVALARDGSQLPEKEHKALQAEILKRLGTLPLGRMTVEQIRDACRAYQLAFIRLGGKPDAKTTRALISRFGPLVPHPNESVNQELTKLLIYLEAPHIIEKSLARVQKVDTQQAQMFYIFKLRTLDADWTLDQRRTFFGWIQSAEAHGVGGNSFDKFLQQIRDDAKKRMSKEAIAKLADVIAGKAEKAPVTLETTRQFVQNWQLADFAGQLEDVEQGRSFKNGKAAYQAAQCAKCHRFAGDGGGTGPDITGVGARFSTQYLLESLVTPSKAISDQYKNSTIVTSDGRVITGRVINKTDTDLMVRTDPFARELTKIAEDEIVEQFPSETSQMPKGLINVLSKEEIFDLIAYLRSAGKKSDPAFGQPTAAK